MAKYFVLVAGNIGAGKTSLTERLGEHLDWETAYESVVDNPYLSDFYQDMCQWAFHLQIFFLGHRAEQHVAGGESQQGECEFAVKGHLPSSHPLEEREAPLSRLHARPRTDREPSPRYRERTEAP